MLLRLINMLKLSASFVNILEIIPQNMGKRSFSNWNWEYGHAFGPENGLGKLLADCGFLEAQCICCTNKMFLVKCLGYETNHAIHEKVNL